MNRVTRCARIACTLLVCSMAATAQAVAQARADAIRAEERIESAYVLHYAPAPAGDVEAIALELLETKFSALRPSMLEENARPSVRVMMLDMDADGVRPPGAQVEQLYRYGVLVPRVEAMQASQVAVLLAFSYRGRDALQALEQATSFTHELAARTDALIWDAETRELFSPSAWAERRMSDFDAGLPEVRKHIAIRAYRIAGDRIRAVTSGMRKFGLPDLVVSDTPWWLTQEIGTTMRLLAQAIVEGPAPSLGTFDLDVTTIRQQRIRKHIESSLVQHPTASVAFLALREAEPLAGDPDNRLIEITFDRYPGRNTYERYTRFTSEFFGAGERASAVERGPAMVVSSGQ